MVNDEEMNESTFTLTDESGKELHFEFLGREEVDGVIYLALLPLEDNDRGEYVILKYETDENGEESLITIDDDDEFDKIADLFEDELFSEMDYDAENGDE